VGWSLVGWAAAWAWLLGCSWAAAVHQVSLPLSSLFDLFIFCFYICYLNSNLISVYFVGSKLLEYQYNFISMLTA
jgi:hypothetical protein